MAANEAKIVVSVDDQASKRIDRISAKAKAMRGKFLAVAGGVSAVGIASVKFASDLEEAANKASVTFGDAASQVETFAKRSADSFGLSQRAALESAASFGVILKATGQTEKASADMSVGLLKLGADMKSFNNIPMDDALQKLRAGLVGEAEPLRQVGILLSDTKMKAKAAQLGLGSLNGELTEGEKVQARYAIIMEEAGVQHGDFTRTAGSLANQLSITQAKMEDASATLGEQLLPIATKVVEAISAVVSWFGNLDKTSRTIILVIGGVAGAVAALGLALPIMATGFGVASAASAVFTAALWAQVAAWIAANAATGGIIIAIGAVVTGIVLLIKNWDDVVRAIKIGINFMMGAVETWANFYIEAINKIIGGINKLSAVFGKEIDEISEVKFKRLNTAAEESAEAIEESSDEMGGSLEGLQLDFTETADVAEGAYKRMAQAAQDAHDLQVEEAIEASKGLSELFQRKRERDAKIAEWDEQQAKESMAAIIAHQDKMGALDQALADKRIEIQEETLAKEFNLYDTRQKGLEALAAGNKSAFEALRATVDLLPSVIPAGGITSGSRPDIENAMRAFKDSQSDVVQDLNEARAQLAQGDFGIGASSEQGLLGEIRRLENIIGSEQFKGTALGALVGEARGGFGGAPPMLHGTIGMGGTFDPSEIGGSHGQGNLVQITVEGSVVAEDLPGVIEKGLQQLADQGGGYVGGAKFAEEDMWK